MKRTLGKKTFLGWKDFLLQLIFVLYSVLRYFRIISDNRVSFELRHSIYKVVRNTYSNRSDSEIKGDDYELPALHFSKHWIDQCGFPTVEEDKKFVDTYGRALARDIETLLKFCKFRYLLKKTSTKFLKKISFGFINIK